MFGSGAKLNVQIADALFYATTDEEQSMILGSALMKPFESQFLEL